VIEGGRADVSFLAGVLIDKFLYHHQYLDRPREQIDFYLRAGSRPLVYGLGNKGADVLASLDALSRGKVDWTAKNRTVGPIFLEHALLVSDFMVSLEVACRQHGHIRVISTSEILSQAPERTRRRQNPLKIGVSCIHQDQKVTLGIIPDQFFGLHYLDKPDGTNKAYFFLEADRCTMPVVRGNFRQTSFYRELVEYQEVWTQGLRTALYGIRNFGVLTVTGSEDRVDNIIAASKKASGGKVSMMFLFGNAGGLELSDPLSFSCEAVRMKGGFSWGYGAAH